jgi:ABC-type amino acid transport substrate-binding protein
MLKRICILLTLSLSGAIAIPVIAQPEAVVAPQKLRVGVAGSAPFVINHSQEPQGISVEIWQEVARRSQLDYQLISLPGVKAGIEAVHQGQLDVLIGPVSISTERLEKVSFTHPYFQARIGLLISNDSSSLWSRVKPLFHIVAISSITVLFLALFVVGNFIWLAEHRRNSEQFPRAYLPGVGSGMWFAIVTLTTVGYGDKSPVTKTGRMITSVWMLITMVAASSLTAGIASALSIFLSGETTEKFTRPAAIENARMAVVEGTTGQSWGEKYNARLIKTANLEQAIEKVLEKEADGVIFDVPALKYYLYQHPNLPLMIANKVTFAEEGYGFVFPLESDLIHGINVSLIALKEEGEIDVIQRKVFNLAPEQ